MPGDEFEEEGIFLQAHAVVVEKKRDPQDFDAAQANLKRLQQAARDGRLSLFYLDESGFSTIPNVQRAWSPKGQTHQADAGIPRQRVNVVGALDYATGKLDYALHERSVNRQAVVDLIDRIAQREQRMPLTIVVLDNASTHHGIDIEKLDDWLINHRLLLMHLPPYSPELNPIEIVWKHAKYHWRRFASWSKDQLLLEVNNLMAGVGSTYKIGFT